MRKNKLFGFALLLMFLISQTIGAQEYCQPDPLTPSSANSNLLDEHALAQYVKEVGVSVNSGTKQVVFSQSSIETNATYSNYKVATTSASVSRGSSVTISWVGATGGASTLAFSRLFIYFDANGNKNFTDPGEKLTTLGGASSSNNTQVENGSYTLQIPLTTPLGVTRVRLFFDSSYQAEKTPCGQSTRKVVDVLLNITEVPTGYRTITVQSNDNRLGKASIEGVTGNTYFGTSNENKFVVAAPISNNQFLNWTNGENQVISTALRYEVVSDKDITLTANFAKPVACIPSGTQSENGYVTSITTADASKNLVLNGQNKPSSLYTYLENATVEVQRNSNPSLSIIGTASLKDCHKYIYLDRNNDGFFSGTDELIFSETAGTSETINCPIEIPKLAFFGTTRIRVKYTQGSDDFNVGKDPCLTVNNGIVYEFNLKVIQPTLENPIIGLLERIDEGASAKFKTEIVAGDKDFFELDQDGDKVVVRGNNYISIATGINWYLKYYANVHLSWSGMKATLPATLPAVPAKERRETNTEYRYHFNFCTFSYGMAFWDWERWQQEIDWMALHGINLPLALTGTEAVWTYLLADLGYNKTEINNFVAGSAYQAWWQMNNMEAFGGPNPDSWYEQQTILGNKIIHRYREFGIEPVLPGYSGMVPSNAGTKLGLNVQNPGTWCSFQRPAFLQPTDSRFEEISDKYYKYLTALFGEARYFTADPFHEGGSTAGVDLSATGRALYGAMQRASDNPVWVIQSWHSNPIMEMINPMEEHQMLILDLFSDGRPKWTSYGKHDWVFCMLHNFGGRIGMMGRIDYLVDQYYSAQGNATAGKTLRGVGATMEGYEVTPVVYELLFELPWRSEKFSADQWLENYQKARYGSNNDDTKKAWNFMKNTVYNAPGGQEGCTEAIMCARPALNISSVSTWGSATIYWNIYDLRRAAMSMLATADQYTGNNNFEYDLVELVAQTLADHSNTLQKQITAAYEAKNIAAFDSLTNRFKQLVLDQDRLLRTRREFMVGPWIAAAKKIGATPVESTLYEWNARMLITTWGNEAAANSGGLKDYSYRMWSGLLEDYYYPRWVGFFDYLKKKLNGQNPAAINFYKEYEQPWTVNGKDYPTDPQGNSIEIAREVFNKYCSDLSFCEPGGSFCVDAGQGYIATAKTNNAATNLNFSQTARPSTVYVNAMNNVIEAKRGSSFSLTVKGDVLNFNGQADYSYFKWTHKFAYIDWNNDMDFDDEGELLFSISADGGNNANGGYLKTIRIPETATLGDLRLRLRFTNGYAVNIKDVEGACQGVSQGAVYDFTLRVLDPAGIDESGISGLRFYPNPATNRINFSKEVKKAIVYDVNGKIMMQSEGNTLSISSLPAAPYVVKMIGADETKTQMLIKE